MTQKYVCYEGKRDTAQGELLALFHAVFTPQLLHISSVLQLNAIQSVNVKIDILSVFTLLCITGYIDVSKMGKV